MKLKINSTLSNKELLDSLDIKQYVDKNVVNSMPRTTEKELDIKIFTIGKSVTDYELEKEYESRGLIPMDPYSLVIFYRESIDKNECIATHWKDENGNWCYIAFDRWSGAERHVGVYRVDSYWIGGWWFAGVRKSSEIKTSVLKEEVIEKY